MNDNRSVIVTVNSGSTSVKLAAFGPGNATEAPHRLCERHYDAGSDEAERILAEFKSGLPDGKVLAVSHRVVHGGTQFTEPIRIDDGVVSALRALNDLAPLHNPPAVRWIEAARRVCPPETAQIAVFDTAFFAGLPRVAAEYALPRALGRDIGVRRYGFHGIAHESLWRRWCELNPALDRGGRLISLQLGGGCSIAAIDRGCAADVSMGFSPLEGLVMSTRSGDADPAIIPYLEHRLGISSREVVSRLNHECGLLGVAGTGDVSALVADGSAQARFALELYCYRLRKYIGAFCAVLGGCDGVVFGGGVGEHVPPVRDRCLEGMVWAGMRLDAAANEAATSGEHCINAPGASVGIWALHTDEETSLARAVVTRA